MRTPKRLYTEARIIYHPELLTCPHCGALLVLWNYLAWDKTVQTLDRVVAIATRPGRCPEAACPGSHMRLLSAEAQRIALSLKAAIAKPQKEEGKPEPEVEEPVREPAVKRTGSGPLKGGTKSKPSGGEAFGLKW